MNSQSSQQMNGLSKETKKLAQDPSQIKLHDEGKKDELTLQ